jgi:hypothetical protein
MGDFREKTNSQNVILGMASPTETINLEVMEVHSRVPSTRKKGYPSLRRMDQEAPSNTRIVL